MIKNKKGWIRVAEAFFAVLLVAGIVVVVAGGNNAQRGDLFERAQETQIEILREIQLDDSLRAEIIGTSGEVEWDDEEFPSEVKQKIQDEKPVWLEDCQAKICNPGETCNINEPQEDNVFSESVIISANLTEYNPRVLKLFCWD